MLRAIRRKVFRRFVRLLAHLTPRTPRIAYAVCDVLAPLVFAPLSRKRLDEVFQLSDDVALRVIKLARRASMRNFMLAESIRLYDYPALHASYSLNDRVHTLPRPSIIGTFHIGALPAVGAGLEILPARALVVRSTPKLANNHPNLEIVMTRGDDQHRARVFTQAIQFLQTGQYVFLPLDPEESARISVPFRGRTMQLARGPFALSRITGAPIVPMIARWNGMRIEYVIGDVIPSGDETTTAAAAASWLEHHLEQYPDDISSRVLELTS